MRALKWTAVHSVFLTEIDDDHKEIVAALWAFNGLLAGGPAAELRPATERLITCISEHFAHEERLMRAARYSSMRWHKGQHDNARTRVAGFVPRIEHGDMQAGHALVKFVISWLHNHTRLADQMMAAFLRNHRRACKLTFLASTKPVDACVWTDSHGNRLDPPATQLGNS